MKDDRLISLNAAKDYIDSQKGRPFIGCTMGEAMKIMLDEVPSAQPEIAENLYLYKCFITDKDGLQHEVIHTGDIRRVTGWMI